MRDQLSMPDNEEFDPFVQCHSAYNLELYIEKPQAAICYDGRSFCHSHYRASEFVFGIPYSTISKGKEEIEKELANQFKNFLYSKSYGIGLLANEILCDAGFDASINATPSPEMIRKICGRIKAASQCDAQLSEIEIILNKNGINGPHNTLHATAKTLAYCFTLNMPEIIIKKAKDLRIMHDNEQQIERNWRKRLDDFNTVFQLMPEIIRKYCYKFMPLVEFTYDDLDNLYPVDNNVRDLISKGHANESRVSISCLNVSTFMEEFCHFITMHSGFSIHESVINASKNDFKRLEKLGILEEVLYVFKTKENRSFDGLNIKTKPDDNKPYSSETIPHELSAICFRMKHFYEVWQKKYKKGYDVVGALVKVIIKHGISAHGNTTDSLIEQLFPETAFHMNQLYQFLEAKINDQKGGGNYNEYLETLKNQQLSTVNLFGGAKASQTGMSATQ